MVLAGDVGSGKSELAETIGDAVARQEKIDITLFPMSLSTRGQGRVGEMTQLLSAAFDYTVAEASKLKGASGKARGAVILLVDEADALAQSREAAQMHHEDRAGRERLHPRHRPHRQRPPAGGRHHVHEPAGRARSGREAPGRRHPGLRAGPTTRSGMPCSAEPLKQLGFSKPQIDAVVAATGAQKGRAYGFTFSDLTQRLLPAIVLDAYPANAVNPARAVEIARAMIPTPPFQEGAA